MARFFLEGEVISGIVTISGDDAKHIARVLRMRPGQSVELVVAGQAYAAELLAVGLDGVTARLGSLLATDSESPLDIHLYQALPKSDKMDMIVQKATELGVTAITPVLTTRVMAKLADLDDGHKVVRWQRIAAEAAKQSRRTTIPTVHAPLELCKLSAASERLRLVAWESTRSSLSTLLAEHPSQAVDLLVGPEGGLAEEEVAKLAELGWHSVSLGPRILRTETAPLVVIAILQYELGDLGSAGGGSRCRE